MKTRLFVLAALLGLPLPWRSMAADGFSGPLQLSVSNTVKTVSWPRQLLPALETNQLRTANSLNTLVPVSRAFISVTTNGYHWTSTNSLPSQYFALTVAEMSSNALLA